MTILIHSTVTTDVPVTMELEDILAQATANKQNSADKTLTLLRAATRLIKHANKSSCNLNAEQKTAIHQTLSKLLTNYQ